MYCKELVCSHYAYSSMVCWATVLALYSFFMDTLNHTIYERLLFASTILQLSKKKLGLRRGGFRELLGRETGLTMNGPAASGGSHKWGSRRGYLAV